MLPVCIHGNHILISLLPCIRKATAQCNALAPVVGIRYPLYCRELFQHLQGMVCAAVVHHDYMRGMRQHILQYLCKCTGIIISRYEYGCMQGLA